MTRRSDARGWGAVALIAVALLGAACDEPTAPAAPGTPITELPRALTQTERAVLDASNDFAFALGGELLPDAPGDNLFYSPLSVSMVLGMLLNGADGDTYAQMRRMLGWEGLSQEEINRAYADLAELLTTLDPAVSVSIGNSVWTRTGFPVLPDFMERVRESFDAEAEDVDFADPGTLPRINGWASEATNGRIEKIFDALPGNVVMVLLNAIHFDADWRHRFDAERTVVAPFTRPDGSTVTAQMMSLDGELRTGRADAATLVELPYGGGAFTMVVALPDAGTDAGELLASLDDARWNEWTASFATAKGTLQMPRFELEWEARLNESLQALGMTDAFDGGRADFARLTRGGGVWLDLVKQKSYVRVDEEGTEAAAVTGAVVVESAGQTIRLDRPFVFVLRERFSGAVLFVGLVNDPTG